MNTPERTSPASPAAPGVIVLGMHRSGTSATTRTLNLLGLGMCPSDDLLGPGPGNERGHWESHSLVECNHALLRIANGDSYHPPVVGGAWASHPIVQALKPYCAETFARAHPTPGWVWKDPRTCLTLDFWLEIVSRPAIVMVMRHPVHVAQSLVQRDGIPLDYAIALWERYVRESLRSIHGLPVFVTWFDDLLDNTDTWLKDMGAFLHAVKIGHSATSRRAIHEYLDGGLRHHGDGADAGAGDVRTETGDEILTPEQRSLLAITREINGFYPSFSTPDLPEESPATGAMF
jgi:hypothetical protein